MYKLVAVAGQIRGQEFELSEGENSFGRDSMCDHVVNIPGVSKKHMKVTVSNGRPYLTDLGSANGTFINGELIHSREIKRGDKIALPDVIFQVVYVKEKKIKVEKVEEEEVEFLAEPRMPENILEKLIHLFKFKVMKVFHGINQEYEWRHMVGIVLSIYLFTTIGFTIYPVLQDSKKLLLYETAKRGENYADQIARLNARALAQKNLDGIDTSFLEDSNNNISYELFDFEGRIVRPLGKLNDYISDPFSIAARNWAATQGAKVMKKDLKNGEIGIARSIITYNTQSGEMEPVGVIAIRFKPRSLAVEAQKNSAAYFEALATSAIFSIFLFGILYYLTIRPIEEIQFEMDEVLKGKKKQIETNLLMGEINPLKNSLNSLLQRMRELTGEASEDDFNELESDEKYVDSLKDFMEGAHGAILILDSEKHIRHLNDEAEDLLGIREAASQGENLLDVTREQAIAATIIELCDKSAGTDGRSHNDNYEIAGSEYNIFVNSLIGSDNFAKAFYISFVKDD